MPPVSWPSALIDLVLGGSTSNVIALVARNLPQHLQRRAILWDTALILASESRRKARPVQRGGRENPAVAVLSYASMKLTLKWLLSAAALLAVAHLYSGVQVSTFASAMVAALVIGLLNTFVRPFLILLTLPVTLITLGLFLFVINALMFWSAGGLLSGFHVNGFGAALVGSLIYSVLGIVIDSALQSLFSKE